MLIINATDREYILQYTYYFFTQHDVEMVNELLINNVQLLVFGAIPYYLEKLLIEQGCNIFSFIACDIDDVLQVLHSGL